MKAVHDLVSPNSCFSVFSPTVHVTLKSAKFARFPEFPLCPRASAPAFGNNRTLGGHWTRGAYFSSTWICFRATRFSSVFFRSGEEEDDADDDDDDDNGGEEAPSSLWRRRTARRSATNATTKLLDDGVRTCFGMITLAPRPSTSSSDCRTEARNFSSKVVDTASSSGIVERLTWMRRRGWRIFSASNGRRYPYPTVFALYNSYKFIICSRFYSFKPSFKFSFYKISRKTIDWYQYYWRYCFLIFSTAPASNYFIPLKSKSSASASTSPTFPSLSKTFLILPKTHQRPPQGKDVPFELGKERLGRRFEKQITNS